MPCPRSRSSEHRQIGASEILSLWRRSRPVGSRSQAAATTSSPPPHGLFPSDLHVLDLPIDLSPVFVANNEEKPADSSSFRAHRSCLFIPSTSTNLLRELWHTIPIKRFFVSLSSRIRRCELHSARLRRHALSGPQQTTCAAVRIISVCEFDCFKLCLHGRMDGNRM